MQPQKISTESIDEGLDRKLLSAIRTRFLTLNEARIERTRSALAERQQIFLDLLPLLFHTNHPMLPGYVSHQTPCGVAAYTPSAEELQLARSLARSFHQHREPHKKRQVQALFIMGSVGTVAHSDSSDMDIWVCHKPGLEAAALSDLDHKCQQLSRWAAQLGLEAHFFLMDCERFRKGHLASLDSEGSGSAQRYLLLDEFYRTGLLIAGRAPLWWFNPTGRERDYDTYTETLLGKRFMRAADVVDFGSIAAIPGGEFIGAGVWQLYKGIESPYKSVLKLMLLECYAAEHPDISPLSLTFKQLIYDGHTDVNELDPYVMVYRRLETYLTSREEFERLELLRRCFYFKVNKPLTKALTGRTKSWQRSLLEKLVKEWGWDANQLRLLDARPQWKAQQVMEERQLLVNEFTNSYRFLVDFARQTHINAAISAEELNILGRKLHAAFERKAGKVEWINPHISQDLSEPFITFVEEKREVVGSFQLGTVWTAYAEAPSGQPFQTEQAIKQSRDLVELITWCHCNGVLTQQTRCEVSSSLDNLSAGALLQTLQAVQRWLPLPLSPVPHESFQHQAYSLSLLLLINVGTDPHHHLHQKGIHRLSGHVDPLGFSGLRENLISTIDLISLNSWNEVGTHHFGNHALLNCLLHYLRLTPPDSNRPLPQLTIRCLNTNRGVAISQRVEELLRDVAACFYSGTRPSNTRYLFEMSGDYYSLQFRDNQPHISHLHDNEGLMEHLGQAQASYSPLMVDRYALRGNPLSIIADLANDTAIQIFYRQLDDTEADVYVVDEKGSILQMRAPFLNHQTLLRPLHRFIRAVIDRQSVESDLLQDGFGIYPIDFYELMSGAQGTTHCERRSVNTDLNKLNFFNVQVIADINYTGEICYTIYCDQKEFSELDFGENLFDAVAQHILSRRSNDERYPCHITDLDLSNCRMQLAPEGRLQISHYLRIKADLEMQLNLSLQSV
ncbi:class I adenylate cyclase [Exilibacterium tricleocarpae]|uniref:Class I adenylate cyclase n=1 Tax=Exilibacterium tricleocarpae TaxID=2591008 RepID=A0A545T0P9_9GAMM|nr:class I adenylate cyclase [Exilibacterium tricleocarpae]TQV70771.1 class I adenylate cyclase [Exilibacterium tricleocarpae]